MKVLLVVDGERDAEALPVLVSKIGGLEVDPVEVLTWKQIRINLGKGSEKQKRLLFAFERAADASIPVVVAVVDTDKSKYGEKLRELTSARDTRRERGLSHQSALGEANPHFDVWLLDDRKAVAIAWQIDQSCVPDSKKCDYPRDVLDDLHSKSCCHDQDIAVAMSLIANEFELNRCIHRSENGLADFAAEIQRLK